MSNFEVLIEEVQSVTDHPNADRLSLVKIRGYNCISAKIPEGDGFRPRYKPGDHVIYIPEDAVVPENLLRCGFWDEKNNKGMLAGSKGDRVKAVKLRGIISQGILYSVNHFDGYDPNTDFCLTAAYPDDVFSVGCNVAELLGIKKYEPVIPSSMAGEVMNIGISNTFKFDIENRKKYDDVLKEGEKVVATNKLHGTFCAVGWSNFESEELVRNKIWIASKGLGQQGLVFKFNQTNQLHNLYIKTLEKTGVLDKLVKFYEENSYSTKFVVMGEVYGLGVQDLDYGLKEPSFRAFDICVDNEYVNYEEFLILATAIGIDTVPIAYTGPYDKQKLIDLATVQMPGTTHVNEGLVIKPLVERHDKHLGRVILKEINPDYLLRKSGTEYQ